MNVFIQSAHASLERDHAVSFLSKGHRVFGHFDIGSKQRDKIVGVTDVNSDIEDFNLIVLHQVPDYVGVMKNLLERGKRVILVDFGQTDEWQYKAVAELLRNFQHAWVAPYSKKDERRHLIYGGIPNKVRMIRFGKPLNEFEKWEGSGGYIYASCNSIQHRGEGCGWDHMARCLKELPLVLSGKETKDCGGIGEITEQEMRNRYKEAAGFISFGTAPAPLVLTQIEAWCAGCPTVLYDNRHGITEEGMLGILEQNPTKMIEECVKLLESVDYRRQRHEESLLNAKEFDGEKVAEQWNRLLEEVAA